MRKSLSLVHPLMTSVAAVHLVSPSPETQTKNNFMSTCSKRHDCKTQTEVNKYTNLIG